MSLFVLLQLPPDLRVSVPGALGALTVWSHSGPHHRLDWLPHYTQAVVGLIVSFYCVLSLSISNLSLLLPTSPSRFLFLPLFSRCLSTWLLCSTGLVYFHLPLFHFCSSSPCSVVNLPCFTEWHYRCVSMSEMGDCWSVRSARCVTASAPGRSVDACLLWVNEAPGRTAIAHCIPSLLVNFLSIFFLFNTTHI